jgi:hypothetical protein
MNCCRMSPPAFRCFFLYIFFRGSRSLVYLHQIIKRVQGWAQLKEGLEAEGGKGQQGRSTGHENK